MKKQKRQRYVYLIIGGGMTKIGLSTDPEARLRGLQGSCPAELRLLAAIPGTWRDEKDLHDRFRKRRAHGEWFIGEFGDAELAEVRRLFNRSRYHRRSRREVDLRDLPPAWMIQLKKLAALAERDDVRFSLPIMLLPAAFKRQDVEKVRELRARLDGPGTTHDIFRLARKAADTGLETLTT